MRTPSPSIPLVLVSVFLSAAALAAQDPVQGSSSSLPGSPPGLMPPLVTRVFSVSEDPTDGADFSDVQDAIDQAESGDIIYLYDSFHDGIVINGKALTVISETGDGGGANASTVRLTNIPGTTVFRGFDIFQAIITDCDAVWIERSTFQYFFVDRCDQLLLSNCEGGDIRGTETNITVYDSMLEGRPGNPGTGHQECEVDCTFQECFVDFTCPTECVEDNDPGTGYPAIWIENNDPVSIFISGSTLTGGEGGESYCFGWKGFRGRAIWGGLGGTTIRILDTTLVESLVGSHPFPMDLGLEAGSLHVETPIDGIAPVGVTVQGLAMSEAWLVVNNTFAPVYSPERYGVLTVPEDSLTFPLATIPMDGSPVIVQLPGQELGPGQGGVLFTQSMYLEHLPKKIRTVLGAPSVIVQIDG